MKALKKLFNAWVLMNKGFEKSIVCLITANASFLYFGDGIEQKQLFLLIDIGFHNITHSQKSFRTIIRTYEEFRCSIGFYNSCTNDPTPCKKTCSHRSRFVRCGRSLLWVNVSVSHVYIQLQAKGLDARSATSRISKCRRSTHYSIWFGEWTA